MRLTGLQAGSRGSIEYSSNQMLNYKCNFFAFHRLDATFRNPVAQCKRKQTFYIAHILHDEKYLESLTEISVGFWLRTSFHVPNSNVLKKYHNWLNTCYILI